MHLVFVDDSKTNRCPRRDLGELVSVGAVFVPEESSRLWTDRLAEIRAKHKVPVDEEIKWNPDRDTFLAEAARTRHELVDQLRQDMLQAALELNIVSAVVVWSRGQLDWPMDRLEPTILEYLYQRVEMELTRHGRGVIIADQPGGSRGDETKWLTSTRYLTEQGAKHVSAQRVVLPIITADSKHVPHLQLADLVTAATTAAIAGRPAGRKLTPLLYELARKVQGRAGGTGIVVWPRELDDLYWWEFGEDTYHRTTAVGSPRRLPSESKSMPFGLDDGLGPHAAGG